MRGSRHSSPTRRLRAPDTARPSERPTGVTRREAPHPAPEPAEDDLALGRYRLRRSIGRGGHGTVWEAFDEHLERPVAVKVIHGGDEGTAPRAEREGRAAARLNHPGIVALYELGSDDGTVYLVSELVRGRTMAELGAAGALSDRDVARIGLALCSALAHAHQRGVIHRDVKPQNVLVVGEPAAGAGFAKLTDFGVARLGDDGTLTRTGDVVGTVAYMAPEQAEGDRVTAAADVYSLALLLYEGWTGAGTERVVAARLGGRGMTPLHRLRRDLPPALCQAVDAALDPRPGARPELPVLEAELAAAAGALPDEGGLVEPATRRRFGIPSVGGARAPLAAPLRWLVRGAAGIAAGSLVTAALALLPPPELELPPLAAGAAAAAVVALLPRIGWLVAICCVLAWMGAPGTGRQGTALVLAAALAPTPLLLPRAGPLWSVPAIAPLLGVIGLAPLFPAMAALASTPWRRAGLAVAGLLWLVAAEILTGRVLLLGPAGGVGDPASWDGSALAAARDAIYPTLAALALAPAALWAALAVTLPAVVRGRSMTLDAVGAALWAGALVVTHGWIAANVAASAEVPEARGAVAGAVLAAAAAVLVAGARRRRDRWAPATVP